MKPAVWIQNVVFLSGLMLAGAFAASAQPQDQIAGPNPPAAQALAPQQLENLVAPIALYPDPLLGQVLAASTYPVELVEAEQWLQANPNLRGQQLMDAARQQNWDPSVQALVAMPDVLHTLTQDVRWTTDLGNAFLAQQADVMSAVQQMRQRAQANGQLRTNPQEIVTDENQNGQQAIEIQPANPDVIYVPSYDPYYVFGYGAYPPLYYPDGYWFGPGVDVGLYFGGWDGWGYGGFGWGWGPNWFGRSLYVNTGFFNRYGFRRGDGFGEGFRGRSAWMHDPAHRLGANYSNARLNSQFGAASQASRMAAGRSGNYRSFSGSPAAANSFRGSSSQSFQNSRSFSAPQSQQRFSARQRDSAPAQQRYSAQSQQRYSAPAQRSYSAPVQRNYSAPVQRSAPAYSAPQRSFQSAPRSAPGFGGGGGGSRSFGGGGGGGGSRASAGGGRGGGRR